MIYINDILKIKSDSPTVLTLGKFDGLHRGHELLMEEMRRLALKEGLQTAVFTFDIPPKPDSPAEACRVITTNAEKRMIFEQAGVDCLIECPFTKEVMQMSPEAFVAWVTGALQVRYIVVGQDFGFGYRRSGDYRTLERLEKTYGYRTVVLEKIREDGRDISSTRIRDELLAGRIEKANSLLGYSFFLRGEVIHGRALGRTWGIPTINQTLPEEKIVPPFGVYLTKVYIDGKWYAGMTNVGRKPTIQGTNRVGAETHILDYTGDLYGRVLTVEFLSFRRPERKFDDTDRLKEQILKDIEDAKKLREKFVTIHSGLPLHSQSRPGGLQSSADAERIAHVGEVPASQHD